MKVICELHSDNQHIGFTMHCPGCDSMHVIYTKKIEGSTWSVWSFNGNMQKPTFSPSLLLRWEHGEAYHKRVCHSFIKNGQWKFLPDCTHELAGKVVDMLSLED